MPSDDRRRPPLNQGWDPLGYEGPVGSRIYVPASGGWIYSVIAPYGPPNVGAQGPFWVPNMATWAAAIAAAISGSINQGVTRIMASLSDITDAVNAETSVEAGVVTLLQKLSADLSAAMASNDPAAMQAIVDQINANSKSLADAVAANTPANQSPSPTPSPTPTPAPDATNP